MNRNSGPGCGVLRIQSDHDEARRARQWVLKRMEATGFPPDDSSECLLAFGEALGNIIRHAYQGRPGQPIDIEIDAHVDLVRIVIRDRAPIAFVPPPPGPARSDDLPEGGHGLFLIRNLVDEVRYVRTGDGVNEVHLMKHRGEDRRVAS